MRGSLPLILLCCAAHSSAFSSQAPFGFLSPLDSQLGPQSGLHGSARFSQKMRMSAKEIYKDLAAIPVVAGGFMVKSEGSSLPKIMIRRSQKDLKNDEARSHLLNFAADGSGSYQAAPFPLELKDVSLVKPSPSGRFLAVIRQRDVKGAKEQSIEVWDNGSLILTSGPKPKLHQAIYSGDVFASLEWSPDESKLVYVAEAAKKETSSFFAEESKGGDGEGQEFTYQDDWGELAVGKSLSKHFVLDIDSGNVKEVVGTPEDHACGQGVWTPAGEGIVFTAFPVIPRRLGLRFYNTRRSRLCYLPAPRFTDGPSTSGDRLSSCEPPKNSGVPKPIWLSPEEDWSSRCPRFSPDGSKLAYTTSADSTTHFACTALKVVVWPEPGEYLQPGRVEPLETKTIVPIVRTPGTTDAFPGYFPAAEVLPDQVWLADSNRIVLHSQWRITRELIVVDCSTSEVSKIDVGGAGSWTCLGASGDCVLAARSSPDTKPEAFVLKLEESAQNSVQKAVVMELTSRLPKTKGEGLLSDIDWEVLKFQAKDSNGVEGSYDAVLMQSKSAKATCLEGKGPKLPLVSYPHGGPHSGMTVEYYASTSLLALNGFSVLLTNYRGSTGYGQDFVESLTGKVGRQDVDDMHQAALETLERKADFLDADKVTACGGSHGGFLSLHLVGQFGDVYKAAAVRNPVTNIATMYGATDIPDWCYTECGSEPTYAQPTAEQYSKAFSMSPMAHVSKIKSPVMLLVGNADRRVPPFQSKEFFYALKERGANVEMLWYDKHTHGLTETPKGEGDGLVNICLFLRKALGMPAQ